MLAKLQNKMHQFESITLEIAKLSLENAVAGKNWEPDLSDEYYADFRQKQGTFTTLYKGSGWNDKQLRGCIGFPVAVYPLGISIAKSSYKAAMEDPRFPNLNKNELKSILYSVEILSPVEKIIFDGYEDLKSKITLGVDGLILEFKGSRGLLLPKVPLEYNWDIDTYLRHMCSKAMVSENALHSSELKMSKFTSTVVYSSDQPFNE